MTRLALVSLPACADMPRDYSGWGAYGGGPEHLRYSSLAAITPANVRQFAVAWTTTPAPTRVGA